MTSAELIKNRIKNARCAVLGFGVSNVPLVELLVACGNEITVHDKADFEKLHPSAKDFANMGVKFITGDGYLDYIDADMIFRSPGIRPDCKAILDALERGATLTSEMELFLELTPALTLGITGSDGKTTTTTIAYQLLEKQFEGTDRKVFVGGNIGTPLLSRVAEMTERDICVLELSSFQLFTMKESLPYAVITNISPNHLDWHKDMDEYVLAKTNIYRHGDGALVINAGNKKCLDLVDNVKGDIHLFSAHLSFEEMKSLLPTAKSYSMLYEGGVYYSNGTSALKIFDTKSLKVPGKHNVENFMAAVLLTWNLISERTLKSVVRSFTGVEHRIEFVRAFGGVAYFNSSIDSSPSRTAAALSAFADLGTKPIVICGGYDKNIPFEPLVRALEIGAKSVVLTGATAEKIKAVMEETNAKIDFYLEKDFDRAVGLARDIAVSGDAVLLSPACASFDSFKNFMERGNRFKEIVNDFK